MEKIVYVGWKPDGVSRSPTSARRCSGPTRRALARARRARRSTVLLADDHAVQGLRIAQRDPTAVVVVWVDSRRRTALRSRRELRDRDGRGSPAGSRSNPCPLPNTTPPVAARRAHSRALHRRVPREARRGSTTPRGSSAGRASTRAIAIATQRTFLYVQNVLVRALTARRTALGGDRRGGVSRRGRDRSAAVLRRDDARRARRAAAPDDGELRALHRLRALRDPADERVRAGAAAVLTARASRAQNSRSSTRLISVGVERGGREHDLVGAGVAGARDGVAEPSARRRSGRAGSGPRRSGRGSRDSGRDSRPSARGRSRRARTSSRSRAGAVRCARPPSTRRARRRRRSRAPRARA